jgi:hypothetical protein
MRFQRKKKASDKRTFPIQLIHSAYVTDTSTRSYGNASKGTERKYKSLGLDFLEKGNVLELGRSKRTLM